jgi:hypothetical protein
MDRLAGRAWTALVNEPLSISQKRLVTVLASKCRIFAALSLTGSRDRSTDTRETEQGGPWRTGFAADVGLY